MTSTADFKHYAKTDLNKQKCSVKQIPVEGVLIEIFRFGLRDWLEQTQEFAESIVVAYDFFKGPML